MPRIVQDFGWRTTSHAGAGRGEIGGEVENSRRQAGAVFNRFGLANILRGGHSVEFYLDEVTHAARRGPDSRPAFTPQTTAEVPCPHQQAGRRY